MTRVALEEAASQLSQLIADARSGEEIVITRDSTPVAKIVALNGLTPRPRFGNAKDAIIYMADDFDEPCEDFKEYL